MFSTLAGNVEGTLKGRSRIGAIGGLPTDPAIVMGALSFLGIFSSSSAPRPLPMSEQISDFTARRLARSTNIGELILFRTYTGDAGQLEKSIGELKLLTDYIAAQSVRDFATRLQGSMNQYGYMTPAELERALEDHLEDLAQDYDPRDDTPAA